MSDLWGKAYGALAHDVVEIVVKKVNALRSAMHPVNHPSVQDAKTRMKSWGTKMSDEFAIGDEHTVHISRPQNLITVVLSDASSALATFRWKRMAGVDVGVFIDERASAAEERLFYGILAVVLSSRISAPINIDDIMVYTERAKTTSISDALLNTKERVPNRPPQPLRARIEHLFYSSIAGAATTLTKIKYNGRVYTVHTGSRGGKYINVLSKKVYV